MQVSALSSLSHETVRLPPASKLVISDELCSLLRELDEAAAKFEFEFVRTLSRRLRTIQEAEDLQIMAVLFSETLMWGLAVRLFSVRQLADRDPTVLLSLPRLAILVGTRILPDSPIGAHRLAAGRRLPFMCNNSRTDLAYLARQLYALRLDQLFRLARWLGPRGLPNINRSRSTEPTGAGYSASGPAANNRLLSPSPDAVMHSSWRRSFSPLPVRRTWKANLAGLHRIYKTVATVADRLSVDFPTELRFILQAVIEMHDTSEQEAALAEETTVSRLSSSMKLDQSSSSTNFLSGAESSVVESVPSSYPSPSSSASESSDTELEDELVVDEKALGSDPKHGSLAKLLDWSDVISHREPRKTRLTDLLRSSTVSALKFAKSEDSLMLTGMPHTDALVRKKPVTMASPDSSSLELGVDVAAMLVGNEAQSSCEQIESRSRGLSELRSYLIESGDGSQTDNSIPNSVTHRLHKLQLGLSVEGVRTPTDRMYHYLPAWQPDRPRDSDRTLPGRMDSEEEDRESDSDDDYSHNDEDAVVYQVGRQCASCLRAFNLFRRRHHCRRCGHIFCASCSSHWQSVEGLATDKPVRICAECHEFLNVQNTA
ncbi:hypothetical protein FGIG_09636 [Fasciola gigantica]|uniref:FYVE-type domain-containing protein n=1 Tax=Fasciola gigantica TaxID=46835 RepID=A0A504Y3Q3_FASGI|nr:hypothetical protein FGIG_09636 [Fasciola gigantica]